MLKFILKKLFWGGFHHLLSDRQYIMVRYWIEHGFLPDLDNPKRLSEKIHYLKLHDRSELRRTSADRLKVRDYVAKKAGEEYLIPLIGHYNFFTEKIWESLPGRFVLKASHGSAMVKIVHNKSEEIFEEVRKLTEEWLSRDYSKIGREWVYENTPREIVVEKLIIDDDGNVASDYKFFCFHGKVKLLHVDMDRFGNGRRNFFNENLQPVNVKFRLPPKEEPVSLPENIREAIKVAEKLSEDFNFIRVDLYMAKKEIYFGELTNFPGNGFNRLEPDEYDLKYGEMLSLEGVK